MAKATVIFYMVVAKVALWTHDRTKSLTQDSGQFCAADVDADAGKAKALIRGWVKEGFVKSVAQLQKELDKKSAGEGSTQKPTVKKPAPKGAKVAKVWVVPETELADLDLKQLNLKIAEMAADAKLEAPEAFTDEVDAFQYLTQDA